MNNELVKYETQSGMVELSPEIVSKYLRRGSSELTEQEMFLFLNLCKYQKLNPLIGEAYPIKFGNDFQMVIGYDTYKRRAEENPTYVGRKSGIVVLRGEQVIQKEGTCLYPGEELIGGWCRVYRDKNGTIDESYKEVGLTEYQKLKDGKPAANWGSKPCTMIEKVAVSQALRAAFPTDYEGMYTEAELAPANYCEVPAVEIEAEQVITQEQRKELFAKAQRAFRDGGPTVIQAVIGKFGLQSTTDMTCSVYSKVLLKLDDVIEKAKEAAESGVDFDLSTAVDSDEIQSAQS